MTATKLRDGQSGLPTAQSTDSYWHKHPSRLLLGHRTTDILPDSADVVVVGTGITGAFAARELVSCRGRGSSSSSSSSVLHLEAREACWGATGRNGGHCQPMVYKSKPDVARFELGTYHFLRELVADNQVPCDWRTVGGVHAVFDHKTWEVVQRATERLPPDLADKALLVEGDEARSALRVPQACGAVYQPNAARLWPYKLVAWVLETLLREHPADVYNLQTSTPVVQVQRREGGWIVHTPRGQVAASHVLLACNAYTSYLLPQMTGVIVPVRGQIVGLTPPRGQVAALEHSHVWETEIGDDDYLIQRDTDDDGNGNGNGNGMLILGGERFSSRPGAEEGVWDDGLVNHVIGKNLRGALGSAVKLRPRGEGEEAQLEAEYEWTGIMGYSNDGYPWVGRVPPSLGGKEKLDGEDDDRGGNLWISAGYTGHGMPVAARCGIRVAEMILGKDKSFDMPREYEASEERARRTSQRPGILRQGLSDHLKSLMTDG